MSINILQDMQRYIQDLRKQKPSDTVTMKKYIKAYSTHHDDYQQSEETKSDKIAKQNNETIRLHPELIPFEISDAKVPDTETLKLIERSKEERKNDNLKEEKVLVKKDMSTAESIMLKITHPGPSQLSARPRSIQQLPVEVQKAINFFVQKENSQKLPSSKYPNPGQSYKTLSIPSKNWWLPINVKSHSITTPLVLNPQLVNKFSPSTKYTYVPSPTYKKFQSSEQNLHTQLPQLQQQAKPVDVLYTFKTDHHPVYTAPKQTVFGEHKYSNSYPPEKLFTNGDQNLVDLTSLIGQTPDLQLQGLGEILEKQEKYYTEKPSIRPQDSTSPVLFPLSARLPKPRPATEKPLFVVNAVSYSTTSAPEVSSKSFIYNELKPHFKNTHLLSSTYFNTKDYIPISENTPDSLPNKNEFNVESPRPVYVAPTFEKTKDTKNFKRNFSRPSDVRFFIFFRHKYLVRCPLTT